MNTKRLMKLMKTIALLNPKGFTFNPSAKRYPRKGYVVASKCTQGCIGRLGLFRVVKFYLKHPDHYIGGWRNEEGSMQYDASKVYYSMEEAVEAAINNKQRAFYNLYTNREISACDYFHFLGESKNVA